MWQGFLLSDSSPLQTPGGRKSSGGGGRHLKSLAPGTVLFFRGFCLFFACFCYKTNVWEPVGEENLYAVVDESSGFVLTDSSGYIIAICDSKGTSKSLVQSLNKEQKDNIVELLKKDNIVEYKGKVALPV